VRSDNVGMFWEDVPLGRGSNKVARVMPPIPDTGWTSPKCFPDLSSARVISVDCETWDPELIERGPGWARGRGHIVGVSVGANGGGRWYFPIRHEVEPEYNLDTSHVFHWLRDTLSNASQPKVGANLLYDLGWLRQEGVEVKGELIDVQYAEALLDERAGVALETLAQKYLGEGKDTNLLYKWCSDFYGGKVNAKQRANIHRAPPRLVGPYAESDADLPLRVAIEQYPRLQQLGLLDLFKMECGLIRLLLDMRFQGVTVDIPHAEKLRDVLLKKEEEEIAKLTHLAGARIDIGSADSLAILFDRIGLPYGRTAKGKPSFTKDFLASLNHPIADQVREIRKLNKLRTTFVESYVLKAHINGKVYGQFHPLRGDDGGTRSGRFSSSDPNLQNIPSRDNELAPLVRAAFIPDAGHEWWRVYDYSQIEYRFLAHFAVGPMADAVRQIFNDDPRTDYHVMTQELVQKQTGQLLDRKPIKNINFGLIYGMGVDALSAGLGMTSAQGKKLFAAYHDGVPYAKATMEECSEIASRTGVITTILGRRSQFDLWESASWGRSDKPALPYDLAIMNYGSIRRAYTHKALNRRLQGSAADMMKVAMLKCYNDGIFNETGVPRLTVHDELDFSDPGGKDAAFDEMRHVLETALPIRVPVRADCSIGPNWGQVVDVE
jgi:DNA polymerase I-like protein with 3'-5' exonuclease and polymerase domains